MCATINICGISGSLFDCKVLLVSPCGLGQGSIIKIRCAPSLKIMLSTNPPVSLLSEESLTTKERVSVTALFEKTEGRLAPTAGRYYLNNMQRFPMLAVALVTLAWTAEGRRTQEANPAAATATANTCDWLCYLNRYTDLQVAFGKTNVAEAEKHWKDAGESEGRDCHCTPQQ